jgi:hypothetical protein
MHASADELERLAETHELTTLTPEEERLLYAFRLFKDRKHKPGAIFTWQTTPEIAGGELPSRIVTLDQLRAK